MWGLFQVYQKVLDTIHYVREPTVYIERSHWLLGQAATLRPPRTPNSAWSTGTRLLWWGIYPFFYLLNSWRALADPVRMAASVAAADGESEDSGASSAWYPWSGMSLYCFGYGRFSCITPLTYRLLFNIVFITQGFPRGCTISSANLWVVNSMSYCETHVIKWVAWSTLFDTLPHSPHDQTRWLIVTGNITHVELCILTVPGLRDSH